MTQARTEIRLAGSGGQGLITAGIILAEAAIYDRKNVVQSQSYGPEARGGASKAEVIISDGPIYYPKEARGGASKAEVIISDGPIYYPKATWVNILLAMSQKACDQYLYDLTMDGTFIADTTYVTQVPTSRAVTIPISARTREKFGKEHRKNQ